jgi:hypothetical protein
LNISKKKSTGVTPYRKNANGAGPPNLHNATRQFKKMRGTTFRGSGALREMVLAFLASQLMWCKETSENDEVQGVLQRMVAVYKKVFTGVYAGGNVTKN